MGSTMITLVPHTHWDREWYEPFSVFSERLVAMMDTLIELADAGFPHFHLDGQTAMIDDYLERRPERRADIERLAASGQLSVGPWVTQMDEFLTSGESHIRNLEMGLARARALAGDRALDVGYMPDQFGHIGQMPQILRAGGLEAAMVWRGVPAEIERTAFWWEAPDGSRVLTEYMVFGYFNGESFERAVEPAELASALERSVERLAPFRTSDRVVIMVGYDHAGPDATLPDRLAAARELAPGIDATIAGIASHVHARRSVELPVWRGELRSSARAHLLPNVYSARVRQKRERGRVEALIERYAEPLATQVPAFGWPQQELDRAWTLLLWNGAHDSACGCSHDQVARDVDARFAEARTIGEDIVERALTSFGSRVRDGGLIRFNPSPFEREGVPGNGWTVVPSGHDPVTVPVAIEILPDGAGVAAEGTALRFFDEADVGDLYNFCYAREDQTPERPHRVEVHGHEVEVMWEGCRALMRIVRRVGERFLRIDGVLHNERTRSPDPFARGAGRRCGRLVGGRAVRTRRAGPRGRGELDRGGLRHLARARGRDGGRHGRPARRCLRVRDHAGPGDRGDAPALRGTDQRRNAGHETLRGRPTNADPGGADARRDRLLAGGLAGRASRGPPRDMGTLRPPGRRGSRLGRRRVSVDGRLRPHRGRRAALGYPQTRRASRGALVEREPPPRDRGAYRGCGSRARSRADRDVPDRLNPVGSTR